LPQHRWPWEQPAPAVPHTVLPPDGDLRPCRTHTPAAGASNQTGSPEQSFFSQHFLHVEVEATFWNPIHSGIDERNCNRAHSPVICICLIAQALAGSAWPKTFLAKVFLICYSDPPISQAICHREITFSIRSVL